MGRILGERISSMITEFVGETGRNFSEKDEFEEEVELAGDVERIGDGDLN